MTDNNEQIIGAAVRLPLSSGIEITVQHLTPLILQRLVDKATELFPAPNPDEYEKKMENVLPGTIGTIPADQNPAYKIAVDAAKEGHSDYLLEMILRLAVRAENEDAIVSHHQTFVDEARKAGILVEKEGDTPLLIVLRNFAATTADFNTIVATAQRRLPLTEGEVSEGRKYFRLANPQSSKDHLDARQRVDSTKQASRPNGKASHEKERVSP